MSTIPTHVNGLSVYLPIWARKKSQKNREGNRRRRLKKMVLNYSNAYIRIRYGAKEITALGCDFVRPVRFTKDGRLPSHRLRTFFFFGAKLVFAQKLVLLRLYDTPIYTTK